jgi:hypothetical protein
MSSPDGAGAPPVLMVGGMTPRSIASALTMPSTAPAAPSVCPIIDFVELAGGRWSAPKRSLSAFGSETSLAGVPVPCRLT